MDDYSAFDGTVMGKGESQFTYIEMIMSVSSRSATEDGFEGGKMQNMKRLSACDSYAISTCFYLFNLGLENNRGHMLFVFKVEDAKFPFWVLLTVVFDVGYVLGLRNEDSIPIYA